jgi:hypothetical protein
VSRCFFDPGFPDVAFDPTALAEIPPMSGLLFNPPRPVPGIAGIKVRRTLATIPSSARRPTSIGIWTRFIGLCRPPLSRHHQRTR